MPGVPPLRIPAPSSSLLKFLKSQTEAVCFFTANPRPSAFVHDHATGSAEDIGKKSYGGGSFQPVRSLSTTPRRLATVDASLSTLDSLCVSTSSLRTSYLNPLTARTASSCQAPRSDRSSSSYLRGASSAKKLWPRQLFTLGKGAKKKSTLDDLPPLASLLGEATDNSMFSHRRTGSNKGANELKLRCTEFDEHGNVTLVNGEFKKSELIAKYGLLPRDLRKIDSSLLPNILVRESAILINLLHIRALIKYNRVLLFDAYGSADSYTQSVFMYDLEGKLQQREGSRQAGGLPYEFRALEAVLISVTAALEGEFEAVREPVVKVLRELEEDIDRAKLRHLLIYSKMLGTFEQKAKLVRDAIDELLDADDDLAAMYLTEKANGGRRGEDDHTEVEMLLESYHKLCDEIVQVSGNLVSNIRNTEEIVKAILDANRNSLMLLDLKFSIGTLGIGTGALIAGFYGMNLKNFIEESDYGFAGVSVCSVALAGFVWVYGLWKLRRVQRVKMWGEQGKGRRGSWRDLDSLPGSADFQSRKDRLRVPHEARAEAAVERTGGGAMQAAAEEALPPVLKGET